MKFPCRSARSTLIGRNTLGHITCHLTEFDGSLEHTFHCWALVGKTLTPFPSWGTTCPPFKVSSSNLSKGSIKRDACCKVMLWAEDKFPLAENCRHPCLCFEECFCMSWKVLLVSVSLAALVYWGKTLEKRGWLEWSWLLQWVGVGWSSS